MVIRWLCNNSVATDVIAGFRKLAARSGGCRPPPSCLVVVAVKVTHIDDTRKHTHNS